MVDFLQQSGDDRIVDATHHRPTRPDALHEQAKCLDDRFEVPEVFEVIRLDVGDDSDLGMKLVEAAVVLVGFHDGESAASTLRVRADVSQDAADDDGRIESGLFQDDGDHRRGGGLAVGAGNADGALFGRDLAEHLLSLHHANASGVCGVDLRVLPSDRRGDHDQIDPGEVGRVVADADVDSAAREEVGGRGVPQIAAGDLDPAVGEDLSNATHSDSADADEMNVLNVFKIHSVCGFANIEFYSVLSIFSSKSTIFFVASGAASVRAAAPISAARCGLLRISAIAFASRSGDSCDSVMTIAPPALSTPLALSS